MKKDFYQQKIEIIKDLIQKEKYQEAYIDIMEEIKMPYIPSIYEKQFQALELDLNRYLKKHSASKSISLAKVITMLYGNDRQQVIALKMLSYHNLRIVKNKLKKRIELWDDNFKKALLYELLVEQEINIDIKINDKIFNPTHFSIFKAKEISKAFQKIEELTFKTPHLLELTIKELHRYLLINFPKLVSDGNKLAVMIFHIVEAMFNKEKDLSLDEQKIKKILNHET